MALNSHVNFTAVIRVITDNGLKVQILHFFLQLNYVQGLSVCGNAQISDR